MWCDDDCFNCYRIFLTLFDLKHQSGKFYRLVKSMAEWKWYILSQFSISTSRKLPACILKATNNKKFAEKKISNKGDSLELLNIKRMNWYRDFSQITRLKKDKIKSITPDWVLTENYNWLKLCWKSLYLTGENGVSLIMSR